MTDIIIQVEHWLQDTISGFQKIKAVFDIPLNADNVAFFTEKAHALNNLLQQFDDAEFVSKLDEQLKDVYNQPKLAKRINEYVGSLTPQFEDFWLNAQDYEGEYINNYSRVGENEELSDVLHEIRSFVKYRTWKINPYDFNPAPTIESVLSEYYIRDSDEVGTKITIPSPIQKSELAESRVKLQWKGDKTDLAEIVWALAKSGRITDTTTGKDVTQVKLIRQIELIFEFTLDVTGLMKGRMNTFKAISDGNTFTKTLLDLVKDRANNV